jgi:hypothetical protein
LDNPQWLHRGNVYGGGSGLGKYQFDIDYDDTIDEDSVTYYDGKILEEDYCQFAGSVLRFTQVDILGGTIHRNVYGGGSMGSVGPLKTTQDYDPYKKNLSDASTLGKQSQCTVNIGGAGSVTIGSPTDYQKNYGGEVYGASRGMSTLDPEQFSNVFWTNVNVKNGATIMGNVFGGGDNGMVKKDTDVKIGD